MAFPHRAASLAATVLALSCAACGDDGGGSTSAGAGSSAAGADTSSGGAAGGAAGGAGGMAASIPSPTPVGCVASVASGEQTIACDGISHIVSVPEVCSTRACGLIVDVHGGTMSAQMEENNTNLRALGRQHGYVVVQPSAAQGLWSAPIDDPKVLAFMQQVMQAWHIDPKRVHMTGFSQGGYMTWRFVCANAELFASVAPAAAAGQAQISLEVGCPFIGAEVPAEPVPILYMHGEQDGLVNFQNGIVQRDAVIASYGLGPGEVIAGDGSFLRTRYAGTQRALLEFLQHQYTTDANLGVALLGHCYPGSTELTPTEPGQLMAFGCKGDSAFHWGEEVIAFFMAHPKP